MPAPVRREARLTTDPTAVRGDLRSPSTDPAPVGGELRAPADPGSIGSKLRLPTHPGAIGCNLRRSADPRAVGGKACLRADEARGRKHEGADEGAHGVIDDTARRRGSTSARARIHAPGLCAV